MSNPTSRSHGRKLAKGKSKNAGSLRQAVTGLLIAIVGGGPFVAAYVIYARNSSPPAVTTTSSAVPLPVVPIMPPVGASAPGSTPVSVSAPAPAPTPVPQPAVPTQVPVVPPASIVDDSSPFVWQYNAKKDEMTGQTTRSAVLVSETTHELSFPYHGGTTCGLRIAQHPRNGLTVAVTIDKGQLTCSAFRGCKISVRFDERPPIEFRGVEPADHSRNFLFLEPEAKFIKQAKDSKHMIVELPFFQEGQRLFHFNTANFKWD